MDYGFRRQTNTEFVEESMKYKGTLIVVKDCNRALMFVGSYKPESIDNLFISIQTFNSQDF